VQNTRREMVLDSDVLQTLPMTRAYGSILNATPGLTVDNNGLATTPTMTFFSAHGGRTNEGRMMINGMTVAAAFNGGGVSSLTYNTSDVDEVSVLVSGGLGESETGGPAMNIVPRSGGNNFKGQAFYNTAGKWSKGDNLDDRLRAIGITKGPGIINSYDASGAYGGPIKRDRLWFYGSYRNFMTAQGVEGIGVNKYAGDASRWNYLRDDSIEPRNVQGRNILSMRFTGQVTPRNRVTFQHEYQLRCEGSPLTPSADGCRKRDADWIALGSTTQSPEANTGYLDFPYYVTQATWTSPLTNKLLLEAGVSRFSYYHAGGPGQLPPGGIFNLIPVTEQGAIEGHRANFLYRGLPNYNDNYGNPNSWRASANYVTGAHNFKAGYQGLYLVADTDLVANESQMQYRFLNGVPNAFTYRLNHFQMADRTKQASLYVQDTWTRNRLSVQGALRYDHASSFSPAEHNGTPVTSRFNAAPVTLERTVGVSGFNDISPRVGAAYDLFGTGKTAVKVNWGRYLAPATNDTIYTENNPASRLVRDVQNRAWTDSNRNFVVDCDILNPGAQNLTATGGDICGALTGNQLNFGRLGIPSTRVNPALLEGWGVRPYDYQWGVNLSHELMPRVSLNVGYNRRWWGSFTVTDDLAIGPSDYERWTITAPQDSRLPGGGGYPVDVYTLTAAAAARPADRVVTFETDFGPARKRNWQGVDVDVNARFNNGIILQAGTSTGRLYEDTCRTVLKIDSPDPRFCHNVEPYLTTLRGLGSYTVPKLGVLVSATVRSQPPIFMNGNPATNNINTGVVPAPTGANPNPSGANYLVPNTVVQGLLGRIPPGGLANGTTVVLLTDNGAHRLYADNRRTQIDMRFAKIVRFGGRRLDVGLDLYNLLNANYASGPNTPYETTYAYGVANGGTWHNPTTILAPRFVRLNFTFDF
jgi:hypothetical protein